MTISEFSSVVDICNRAIQIAGGQRITALTDDTREATECNFAYDKIRRAELRKNTWTFATRKAALRPIDTDTRIITPPAFSTTTYYQYGQVVSYSGLYWSNNLSMSYGLVPGTARNWVPYFGPLTVTPYDSTNTTGYYAGELVYGIYDKTYPDYYLTYAALNNGESDDPSVVEAYDSATTYAQGETVSYSASNWISTVPDNVGTTPANTYVAWAVGTTYASAANVVDPGSGRIYTSAQNSNTGHPPATDDGTWWTTKATSPYFWPWLAAPKAQARGWTTQPVGVLLSPPQLRYPINSGPVSDTGSRNTYMLPAGYVRKAPQNPLPNAIGVLGGPVNNIAEDWEFENNCFVSASFDPIIFRFVADVTDVLTFDPLFSEALAAKLAVAIHPIITQSEGKLTTAAALYKDAITNARLQNGIENGPVEAPQDEYISVRM